MMSNVNFRWPLAAILVQLALLPACGGGDEVDDQPDGSADTDTDTDTDTDADTDTESGWGGPGSGMCDGVLGVQLLADGGASDTPLGIERCPGDIFHRYDNPTCLAASEIECTLSEDCGGDCPPGDVCSDYNYGECACITPCASDDDCDPGEICLCRSTGMGTVGPGYGVANVVQHCVPAGCRTDADCAPYRCGVAIGSCGGVIGTQCHTAIDACEGADQCTAAGYDLCDLDFELESWFCDGYSDCD
jgi:hypothetical protein